MSLEQKLKQLCKEVGDILIEGFDHKGKSVDVLLPYETTSVSIELEGQSEDELVESFKEGVNRRIDDMINHLNDCKLQ